MQAVRLKLLQCYCLSFGLAFAAPATAGIDIYLGDDTPPVSGEIPSVTEPDAALPVPEIPNQRPRPNFDGGKSDRLALVISMQDYDYPQYDALDSPAADGDAIARGLRISGYRVMRIRDADHDGLDSALDAFSEAVKPGNTVAVYYTGLGIALPFEKDNRLVPADFPAMFSKETDVALETAMKGSFSLSGDVLAKILRRGPRALIVFHDACSVDALADHAVFQQYDSTAPCKPVILSSAATLYASGPGAPSLRRESSEDPSPLSVFPRAVLKAMSEDPSLEIDAMMRSIAANVRDVASSLGERQSPVTRIALSAEVRSAGLCVAPKNRVCTQKEKPTPATLPAAENPAEVAAWQSCLEATSRGPCEQYLERFPDGPNARTAERRRIELASDAVTMNVEEYVPFSGSGSGGTESSVDVQAIVRACDNFAAHPSNEENPEGIQGISYRLIDETKALPACLKAVEVAPGNLRVRYQLARAKQAAGQGEKAVEDFLELATEHAYVPAINNLGSVYQLGLGVEKDEAEAARWFQIAAEKGFIPSMAILGWMYQSGRGVPKDNDSAYKFYSMAAEGGLASAMHNLGFMYQNGWGVKADESTAAEWFEKSAEEGFPQAMGMTGWLYHRGKGVEKNLAKASDWYRKAAQEKLPSAMGALGGIYDSGGDGVVRSPKEAAKWLVMALRNKHAATRTRLLDKPKTLREDTRMAIQAELIEQGFDAGSADGNFGGKTRDAIEAAFGGS